MSQMDPVRAGASRPLRELARRAGPSRWLRAPTILLIEDDPELRRLLARALRRDGYELVECANGDDALDWLGPGALEGDLERRPALIVSDVRLPYFTGLEILAGVGQAAERIPVILITGFPDEATYAAAFRLGARTVLAKPFPLADLRAAVWVALQPGHRPPRTPGAAA
jgi:DNA-binding response OmpR family regulator